MKRAVCRAIAWIILAACLGMLLGGCRMSDGMEPTKKLVLYCPPGMGAVFMDQAKYQYEAQYPDVEVEYRTFTQGGEAWLTNAYGAVYLNPEMTEAFQQALTTELNAGKGPDAVVFISDTFPDLDKVIEAGAFCDLAPFFEEDADFHQTDYLTALFDVGRCQGEQRCVPIWYNSMYVISQSDALEAAGIHLSGRPSFWEWSEQIRGFVESHTEAQNRRIFPDHMPRFDYFVIYSGLRIVDYTSKELLIDTEEFRRFMEFWKVLHPYSLDTIDVWSNQYDDPVKFQSMKEGKLLFAFVIQDEYITELYQNPWEDCPDLLFPFPQCDGDFVPGNGMIYAAINQGSPNKQNAYNFIKILLSYTMQNNLQTPVQKDSLSLLTNDAYTQALADEVGSDAVLPPVRSVVHGANAKLLDIVYAQMLPYFEGRETFESCRDALRSYLELYIQE